MAVIRGNFRYTSYYNSIDELIEDEYVQENCEVSIKNGSEKKSYYVTSVRGENSFKLNNGLYAVECLIGNSSGSDFKKQYVKNTGTDINVGMLEKGRVPKYTDINFLLDDILYDGFTKFTVTTNLNEEIHVKGERHTISRVNVHIDRSEDVILKVRVSIGSTIKEVSGRYVTGSNISVPIEYTTYSDTDIVVICYSKDKVKTQTKRLTFRNPVYYGMVNESVLPGAEAIKRMSRVMDYNVLTDKRTLHATEFFIAIPSNVEIVEIKDENGIPITDIFKSYSIDITHDQITTRYKALYSRGLYLSDYTISYYMEGT